jgi:hypothetical protein
MREGKKATNPFVLYTIAWRDPAPSRPTTFRRWPCWRIKQIAPKPRELPHRFPAARAKGLFMVLRRTPILARCCAAGASCLLD